MASKGSAIIAQSAPTASNAKAAQIAPTAPIVVAVCCILVVLGNNAFKCCSDFRALHLSKNAPNQAQVIGVFVIASKMDIDDAQDA